ncbi:hypothetical protein JQU17_12080 [Ponticoccus sp. SC2-23]|uniref:hypothetical protein n=1 Tax=Alexandriicola marinus TaxID=2081710 RepID=UPI000FD8A708|nr:hypothetical protein [Alexandriicola marinus]MBM1221634.1 hypothetical protein [Ponticoccus sp. SC6-9]MBM1226675.1 hypothetical protein [Ponticoccus sp. SC6-15]MBM1230626.1 hypothetical protein [Ponticoccus sp. SC6-38]MBM1235149.1 hypothetical protein [Ponticoccus sp. SC6-45]MBM1239647.1 hypothetical protein [Ponticoccus sp. SC6-49]MBM1243429.1 hypothetical protein [Ponticoccus sp. SC2-64]MBM1248673.1 hypothetical protein [Ponticoccus sp. SC6-42]MBM1253258.1 hypothetical protein [Pontico
MSTRPPPKPVENYTDAFLVSFGVVLFMAFCVIAYVVGFLWAMITGYVIDRVIRLIGNRIAD